MRCSPQRTCREARRSSFQPAKAQQPAGARAYIDGAYCGPPSKARQGAGVLFLSSSAPDAVERLRPTLALLGEVCFAGSVGTSRALDYAVVDLALVCYAHLPCAQLEGTSSFALLPPLSVAAVKLRVNVVSSRETDSGGKTSTAADGAARPDDFRGLLAKASACFALSSAKADFRFMVPGGLGVSMTGHHRSDSALAMASC